MLDRVPADGGRAKRRRRAVAGRIDSRSSQVRMSIGGLLLRRCRSQGESVCVSVLPVHAATTSSHSLNSPLSPSITPCLLYTSDAADDLTRVDLGGRRIIKNRPLVN